MVLVYKPLYIESKARLFLFIIGLIVSLHLRIVYGNFISEIITGDTASLQRKEFDFGGKEGFRIFDNIALCSRCYYSNYSTESLTFPPPLINGTPYNKTQASNNTASYNSRDQITIVYAIHHGEQRYSPRENIKEIEIDLRGPKGITYNLILSNNQEDFININNQYVSQTWSIRAYDDVVVNNIISHSISHKKLVKFTYKYNFKGSDPNIYYFCGECDYPTVTETAYDFQSGGIELIQKVKNMSLVSDYTFYIGCAVGKSMQLRNSDSGYCYSEIQWIAVLFIVVIYAVVGGCLLIGFGCIGTLLGVGIFCSKQFRSPEFL
ncbi:hypothetical protein ABK040_012377 [Willaertia magna]